MNFDVFPLIVTFLGFSKFVRFGLAEKAHKRIAALDLVNQQMKVYFRLKTIRLSAALVSAVEGTRAMPFESFPASARVTYKYYTGRIAVFDENFVRPVPPGCCYHKLRVKVYSMVPGLSLRGVCTRQPHLCSVGFHSTARLPPVTLSKHVADRQSTAKLQRSVQAGRFPYLTLCLIAKRRRRQRQTCCMR